jgi:threonine dehydratase
VVTGQGTVALEVMDQVPDVQNIIVAIGGGGLAAGVAVAAKLEAARQGRKIKIYGVQSEHAAAYPPSLEAGHEVEIKTTPTIADGIAVNKPGHIPFELIKQHVDKVVTVSENEIAKAILTLLERSKQVVEPAGAVGVAALLSGAIKPKGTTTVILSGGNIDPMLLEKVIQHGLAASERIINVSVMLPDRPGQLVATAQSIAAAGGNVVEVLHSRHGNALQISAVELNVSVETGGHEHSKQVLKALKEAGLNPRLNEARVE